MRIVSGIAKGKKLCTPEGHDVRPTIDRVKEAVFSSLQFDLEGRRVLDLFAGSGQLGLESLSRGAACCDFVDGSAKSIDVIKTNVKNCGMQDKSDVSFCDSFDFISRTNKVFDIAFLDPPYGQGLIGEIMPILVQKMSNYGVIVCEHNDVEKLNDSYGEFEKQKVKRYGKVYVTFYRKSEV